EAEEGSRAPPGDDRRLGRKDFPDERARALGADAVRLEERPALGDQRIERAARGRPEAGLHGLAAAAGGADVVARGARGGVEHRSEAVRDAFDGLERRAPVAEAPELVRGEPAYRAADVVREGAAAERERHGEKETCCRS